MLGFESLTCHIYICSMADYTSPVMNNINY
nr:MAG TPA: hypothetical protein [Caudoviricetes sp.]